LGYFIGHLTQRRIQRCDLFLPCCILHTGVCQYFIVPAGNKMGFKHFGHRHQAVLFLLVENVFCDIAYGIPNRDKWYTKAQSEYEHRFAMMLKYVDPVHTGALPWNLANSTTRRLI
jgi:hypothetical protein